MFEHWKNQQVTVITLAQIHTYRWKANLHKKSPNHDAEKNNVLFYGRLRKIGKNL
jgi:hypothetical protein